MLGGILGKIIPYLVENQEGDLAWHTAVSLHVWNIGI